MIKDMSVRNFNEKTRNDYIRQVRTFTAFLRRSTDTATPEDLRRYQLHQTQAGVRPSGINATRGQDGLIDSPRFSLAADQLNRRINSRN